MNKKSLISFLALFVFGIFPMFSNASIVTIELARPSGRYDIDEAGFPTSFLTSGLAWKLSYEHHSETSKWAWGGGYSSEAIELDSEESQNVISDSFTRSKLNIYVARSSSKRIFGHLGLDYVSTPYFFVENFSIDGEQKQRFDVYALLGMYFRTRFGGGELSYKYSLIPNVSIDGNSVSGSGSQFYVNLFFNEGNNYGLFFKYEDEYLTGDFRHTYFTKSIGLTFRF